MIHYHGTPIGGSINDAIYALSGRHALVSWYYPAQLHVVMECCASFIIDNGAFSAWRNGESIDPAGYVDWLERENIHTHPGFQWAVIPDVIDGTEEQNDSWLLDWPAHIQGVPVFHLHESLERAERLSRDWPVVALGSSGRWADPGTKNWWRRMNELRGAFCDETEIGYVPRCHLHGLRMLDPAIFTCLPLASADSSNAGRNAVRNGTQLDKKFTAGQGALLTAMRVEAHNSVRTWELKPVEELSPTLFDWCDSTTHITGSP